MIQQPLLSVCVPTYNGASSYLKEVLETIVPLAELYPEEVEIIVSDNASSDSTSQLLDSFAHSKCLTIHRNEKNIGFNGNMSLITDVLSKGEYTWLIGDDDIINGVAFEKIIKLLRMREVDYISLGSGFIEAAAIKAFKEKIISGNYIITSYEKAIDNNCCTGNVLSSFIGSSIFRTDLFRNYPKDFLHINDNHCRLLFPNAYILASVFINRKSACIRSICVSSVRHGKNWSNPDSLFVIFNEKLPQLYDYIIKIGANDRLLSRTRDIILFNQIRRSISKKRRTGISFSNGLLLKGIFRPRVVLYMVNHLFRNKH